MTLLNLKYLGVVAMSVTLAAGGFGVVAIRADDKKPRPNPGEVKKPVASEPVKKPQKPDAQKPDKPKPDGEKPDKPKPEGQKKPVARPAGRIASVDAKANTITVVVKGDAGLTEKVVQLAPTTKVFIDGKEAKLEAVPKGAFAALVTAGTREGVPPEVAELRVTGRSATGVIDQIDAGSITLAGEKNPVTAAITADTKVTVNGKDARPADLKAGDKVQVTLTTDEKAALAITGGRPDAEKPGAKPAGRFGAKVVAVDAANRLITLDTKTDSGIEVVVRLTADGKVTVDGKEARLADLPKGATVTFTRAPGKEGQPREVSEVVATGETFAAVVRQADGQSVTVAAKIDKAKDERVVKLATAGKVTIDGKPAKLADLNPGDKVTITLTTDGSAALAITSAAKDKEEEDQ
jgi:ribosomal 50S subunit-recycling heat shock protein